MKIVHRDCCTVLDWMPVDPLGEALHLLRMDGIAYTRSELTEPWAVAIPKIEKCLMFHAVFSGQMWIRMNGHPDRLLQAGDFILLPRGTGHILSSDPHLEATNLFDIPRQDVSERFEVMRYGGDGNGMSVICGVMRLSNPAGQHLLSHLPRMITIEATTPPRIGWVNRTLGMIADEAIELKPGSETVMTRLADVMIVRVLRNWMERTQDMSLGWLRALADRQIGSSILMIHRQPEHPWTVASLARGVGMSRSAFAARFKRIVGESPFKYVIRWRMNVAQAWLLEGTSSLSDIAYNLGYQSEAAFSRAFKRVVGMSPGAARQSQKAIRRSL